MVTNSEVEKIVILYKNRLLRFGFEIMKNIENGGENRHKFTKTNNIKIRF